MPSVVLSQLPIPRQNFGRRTGNIPLGAACLKQAAQDLAEVQVQILPQHLSAYLGDASLIEHLKNAEAEVYGFTVFSWNLMRSLYFAQELKAARDCRILFGGPEITPDNALAQSPLVDFLVYGEGEALFRRLLNEAGAWSAGCGAESASEWFQKAASPYLSGMIDPAIENLMLVETQRGCPYRCGFCFYNKSRRKLAIAEERNVLKAVAWAVDGHIDEVYLLDPSLNSRPRLKPFLTEIARLNAGRRLRLFSEIRAEAVDEQLADLLAAAGFHWFEIGLQSTNPKALELMNRPTDLKRFVAGARHLKDRGITPSIDLIIGLPGDDLPGFMRSVDFVADHGLQDDVQIFPLSILPGTDFRRRHRELGLRFENHPPYTVAAARGFSPEDFLTAYDYAESRLDAVFFPLPDLDVAWRLGAPRSFAEAGDLKVRLGKVAYVAKLVLNRVRPLDRIRRLARRLTQPYQVLVGPELAEMDYLKKVLAATTAENPFTPLEVVFFEPVEKPKTHGLLAALNLSRPHFLDGDLRFQFPKPGNRAVLFTLVSENRGIRFQGEMERQVYWWRKPALPLPNEMVEFEGMDGILIDPPAAAPEIIAWQDRFGREVAEKHNVSFADADLQRRWLRIASPDEYVRMAMHGKAG